MTQILEFLNDYNIQYWENHSIVSSGYVGLNCPFCQDHAKPYLGIRKDGSLNSSCWRCGAHNTIDTVEALTGITSKPEIYKIIKKYKGKSSYNLPTQQDDIKRVSKVILPGRLEMTKMARKYLIKREFNPEYTFQKYQLQNTVYEHPSYRLIFPFLYQGRVVSWTGRSMDNDPELRWLSAKPTEEVISHKSIFYNWDNQRRGGNVLLVEGILDAVRTGGMATAGTSVTMSQLALLRDFKKVNIMFDGSPDAIKKAHEISVILSSIGVDNEVLELEEGEDPDTAFRLESDLIALKKDLNLY